MTHMAYVTNILDLYPTFMKFIRNFITFFWKYQILNITIN